MLLAETFLFINPLSMEILTHSGMKLLLWHGSNGTGYSVILLITRSPTTVLWLSMITSVTMFICLLCRSLCCKLEKGVCYHQCVLLVKLLAFALLHFLLQGQNCLLLQVSLQRRQWHPTPVLLPGKSHGWRSLVGCSPWGHEESDTTERLHFHFSLFTFMHWRRKWQPTPVFLPGESQGRESLVGCRLWGLTESDTTEAT